mgnify:FL=1
MDPGALVGTANRSQLSDMLYFMINSNTGRLMTDPLIIIKVNML